MTKWLQAVSTLLGSVLIVAMVIGGAVVLNACGDSMLEPTAAQYASELNEELSRVELIDSSTYPAFSVSGSWRGFSGSTTPNVNFAWTPFGKTILANQPYTKISFVEDEELYVKATFTANSLLGAGFMLAGGWNARGLNEIMDCIESNPKCLDYAVSSVEIHGPLHRLNEIVTVIQ